MSTTWSSPVVPFWSPMEPSKSIGGAQTRSCAWAKRTSRIWSHYACITADRQSKHGISRVLIARDPGGLELLQQPGAGTDGDCAWDSATASREKQKTDPLGPPLPIKLTNLVLVQQHALGFLRVHRTVV